jgi:hypothetical protein
LVNPWSNFAAFFKFHLNTSKSPNVKVVYFVEGHNFHVEWHCWFEVQIGKKCRSTPPGTVHWSRVFCKVPLHFMQNPLIKTLYALSRSCRGSRNLEFSYKSFGPLLLKNFEKRAVKQCYFDVFQSQSARARVGAALRAHPATSAHHRTRRTRTPTRACDRWFVRRSLATVWNTGRPLGQRHVLRTHPPAGCAALLSVFWTGKPTKGVPEVVDCAVGIMIGRPRTRRYVQGHGTQDLYRFGLPRWQTLRPVWRSSMAPCAWCWLKSGARLGTRPSFI